MSDGNRSKQPALKLIALCFALIGLAGGIGYGLHRQSVYEQIAEHRISDYAKHARKKINQSCIVLSGRKRTVCLEQAQTEYELERRDNERDEYDLIAQRRSALWTAIMGVAALVGMGLSAIGVWLVWTTFNATKKANQIAQTAFEYQVRPWIKIKAEVSKIILVNDDVHVRVFVDSINVGQAPANNLSVCVKMLEGDWPSPRILNVMRGFFSEENARWQETTLFSGDKFSDTKRVESTDFAKHPNQASIVVVARYMSPTNYRRFYYTCQIFDLYDSLKHTLIVDFKANASAVKVRKRDHFNGFAD